MTPAIPNALCFAMGSYRYDGQTSTNICPYCVKGQTKYYKDMFQNDNKADLDNY